MTKAARLAELERAFSSPLNCATGELLKLDEYLSKRAAIEAEQDDPPAPAPKAAEPRQDKDSRRPPMKLSTRILADELVDEIKEFVRREAGELKGTTAAASRVAELSMRVQELEERIRVLEAERAAKTSRVVRVA